MSQAPHHVKLLNWKNTERRRCCPGWCFVSCAQRPGHIARVLMGGVSIYVSYACRSFTGIRGRSSSTLGLVELYIQSVPEQATPRSMCDAGPASSWAVGPRM